MDLSVVWDWLSDGGNERALGLVLAGLFPAIAALWAIYKHYSQKDRMPAPITTSVTASQGGVAIGGNLGAAPGGAAVVHSGHGHVYLHVGDVRDGVSEEKFKALVEELGVTTSALKSFFKILEQKEVPPEDLDSTLRQFAERYRGALKRLAQGGSSDPAVIELERRARQALDEGDFDSAETFLRNASDIDIDAATKMQKAGHEHLLAAAAKISTIGDLKYIRLSYADAAKLYGDAASLLPPSAQRGEYLTRQGKALKAAGDYSAAEKALTEALSISEKFLGADHLETAYAMNNLAELYRIQHRFAEAESLLDRAMQIFKRVLGPDHLDTAMVFNNLGAVYNYQGRYRQAESSWKKALAVCTSGSHNVHLATTLNNLAELYRDHGRPEEAERLFKRALEIRETAFGREHPETAEILNNLAAFYRRKRRYDEAELLGKRALRIRENAFGSEHPETAYSLNNLAVLYASQGRYKEAKQPCERALAIREKVYGPAHPLTRRARGNYKHILAKLQEEG